MKRRWFVKNSRKRLALIFDLIYLSFPANNWKKKIPHWLDTLVIRLLAEGHCHSKFWQTRHQGMVYQEQTFMTVLLFGGSLKNKEYLFKTNDRNSHQSCYCKNKEGVSQKKFRNIHRKTPVLESLFNKVTGLQLKKRFQHRCFPGNIAKFLRIPILTNIRERLLP